MDIKRAVKTYIAKRLFGYGPSDSWSYVDQMNGPTKDIKLLGVYSGITYACINAIAEEAGKYSPYLYKLDAKGNEQTVAEHQFLKVLQRPNPDLSQYQLFEGSASFIEQFGEFFWYMVPGQVTGYANGVKQIYLLRPDKMGITVDKNTGEVLGYTYNNGIGGKIPFTAEEIIHHMTFNPRNPYRGYSTVEAAIDYISTEEEVSRFTRNYFANNAAMSGILSVKGKVAKENWQKFQTQWREKYQGVENAGKVALLRDSQIEFTPIGSNVNDMNLKELKETTLEQIMMMFRVPKGILGMESDGGLGRASVETLEYIFAKRTIDPKLCRLDDTLQRCMERYYAKDALTVGHRNIIPADKEFELSVYNQGVDRWLTRKEIRSGDPSLASNDIEGSDQLFVPINMIPVGEANPEEAATDTGSETANASAKLTLVKAKKGSVAEEAADAPVITLRQNCDCDISKVHPDADNKCSGCGRAYTEVRSLKKKVVKSLAYSIEQKEAFRLDLQQHANTYTRTYKLQMNKALDKQRAYVIDHIGHLAKGLADDLFNLAHQNDAIRSALLPVLSDLVQQQGALALRFAGDEDTEYTITRAIQTIITESTLKMARNFNEQTLLALNRTLAEGVANEENLDKLSSRVSDVYDEAKSYRTERVARTESQNASNAATVDAYKQTSFVSAMEWYTNPGGCDFCEALDGKQVGLDETFVHEGTSVDATDSEGNTSSYQADYGDVDNPPLHPNCECTIIPVTSTN